MALKTIMLRKQIGTKQAELETLRGKDAEFETREAELETAIDEAETEEQRQAVSEAIDAYDADKRAHEENIHRLEQEISDLETQMAEAERSAPAIKTTGEKAPEERSNSMNDFEIRANIRELPTSRRAFEAAYTREQRKAFVAQPKVKEFLERLRSFKGETRAISGGELTVPVEMLDLISVNMLRYSKLMNRVRVRDIRGQARQTVSGTIPEAVWTEMCGALNELNFVFNQVEIDGYKVGGFVPVCNALLEDSDIALASWIIEMISESLGKAKDAAILYGTGNRMPLGVVTRLAQTSKPADYPANAPAWTDLHTSNIKSISADLTGAAFWAALNDAAANDFTLYNRGEEFWAMNTKTYRKLMSKAITFTAEGNVVANLYGTLPVIGGNIDVLEFIPDGDIIGGYGDLYLWGQRESIVLGADPTGRTNRILDETLFFGKERADGLPVIAGAFVAININGSAVTTTHSFPGDTANNANLASLAIGETLSPSFDAGVVSYTATASRASDTVTAIADDPDAQVVVEYNGAQILNGSSVTWVSGTKNLVVTVKKGTATKVYTVAVTKS